VVWIGKELPAVLGIGKLTAAAKGKTIASAVPHLYGLTFEKVDCDGFFNFRYRQIAEYFHMRSPLITYHIQQENGRII
jgi:hypothetical protein